MRVNRDLDGDQELVFDEFLATIVHLGMGAADHLLVSPIKHYHEGSAFRGPVHLTEQIISYLPGKDRLLVPFCFCYMSCPDRSFVCQVSETNNRTIKLYDPSTM